MYESQRKFHKPRFETCEKIDKKTSKLLNKTILECIIEDLRPFGDFRKKGNNYWQVFSRFCSMASLD